MPTKEASYDQAVALQQEGRLEEAIEQLETLIGQDPDYALAHAALSVFYGRIEQFDKSIEHGRKVCELESSDPFSFIALSLICQKAGNTQEAEQALLQARKAEMDVRKDTAD